MNWEEMQVITAVLGYNRQPKNMQRLRVIPARAPRASINSRNSFVNPNILHLPLYNLIHINNV
jgi:hypothetical protein